MAQFLVTVNYSVPDATDPSGAGVRRSREVDFLASLTVAQQTAVATMFQRVLNAVEVQFPRATVTGIRYVP